MRNPSIQKAELLVIKSWWDIYLSPGFKKLKAKKNTAYYQ
jgi:hypothetical protein